MIFCPLFSGSSGNAAFVEADGMRLLIDAGVAGREIESALKLINVAPDSLDAILVSHEHSDHVKGVGVMARRYHIPVYANAACWEAMPSSVGEIAMADRRVFRTNEDFYVGRINVLPFASYHDSADPVGFRLSVGGQRLCTMTDVGHIDERLLSIAGEADVLLLEANHDIEMLQSGPYPYRLKQRILSRHGHLSNADAGLALEKLAESRIKQVILGHLSRQNNSEELAYATVYEALDRAGMAKKTDLCVAGREGPRAVFQIA